MSVSYPVKSAAEIWAITNCQIMTNFVKQITNFGLQSCFIARVEIMLFGLTKFYYINYSS
jgi:hypothetical protein